MDRKDQTIKSVERWPKKVGKAEYLRHLKGARLTRGAAIKAKCYECVGGEDTRPCNIAICALKPYCPWNRKDCGETGKE
ncbi:MAG: hypothetical protein CXR31_03280 [Geobacter sp.]|nr:MAG: hypothetical protein CXR31_03280 [Geobacter sp.]